METQLVVLAYLKLYRHSPIFTKAQHWICNLRYSSEQTKLCFLLFSFNLINWLNLKQVQQKQSVECTRKKAKRL